MICTKRYVQKYSHYFAYCAMRNRRVSGQYIFPTYVRPLNLPMKLDLVFCFKRAH